MSRRDHAKTLNSLATFTLLENVRAISAALIGRVIVEKPQNVDAQRKSEELRSFLFLTAVMVPVLSVIIVAGYGFIVWATQLLSGPPTH